MSFGFYVIENHLFNRHLIETGAAGVSVESGI